MKNENLAVISGLMLILAVLASLTVLLVQHIIRFDQAGVFLAVVAVPLAAIAGSPLFSAALKAPSPDQTAQLHATLNQSIQAQAQTAQTLAQAIQPAPAATSSDNVGASTSAVVNPVLPIANTTASIGPINWLAVPPDPQDTFPHAAVSLTTVSAPKL